MDLALDLKAIGFLFAREGRTAALCELLASVASVAGLSQQFQSLKMHSQYESKKTNEERNTREEEAAEERQAKWLNVKQSKMMTKPAAETD